MKISDLNGPALMKTHPLLDRHSHIAWDIDGTLYQGKNARRFCSYIAANPQKKHFIVTFRTPTAWALAVYDELAPFGVTPDMIAGVYNVPDRYWLAYANEQDEPDHPDIAKYYHWKGLRSAELGCTVLVDDMRHLVIQGCAAYGVTFVDANDPAFAC